MQAKMHRLAFHEPWPQTSLLLTQRPLPIFINVNSHRLHHSVAVKAHLEIKSAAWFVAAARVSRGTGKFHNLPPIHPAVYESVLRPRKSNMKEKIQPLSLHVLFGSIQSHSFVTGLQRHEKLSALIPQGDDGIFG